MATVVFPVAVVLAAPFVVHLANAVFAVVFPVAFVLVAVTFVAVDASALTDAVEEVALVLVTVGVESCRLARAAARVVFNLAVLSNELVFSVTVLSHVFA